MIYKTIDLCAGIGGIRRGFELTGQFRNVLSAEINPEAAKTYEHLYGDNPLNDLTSDTFKEEVIKTDYDVLLAGFPCQAFSRIGKRLGFRDKTRGTIFFDIADIIFKTEPRAVFLENVENLVSHDGGRTIRTIVETLENELQYRIIGVTLDENGNYTYTRKSFLRNSRFFGVPQNRPRVYIMAFSKKRYGNAVKVLTENLPESGSKIIFADVNQVLDSDVDPKYYLASGYLETLKRHKARQARNGNGFGYCVVNQKHEVHPVANTILATGGSGKERNLVYQPKDGVGGTVLPSKKTALNNEGIRMMTPAEWGRLQGFIGYAFMKDGVDTFSFPEGTTNAQKYKQLGNSVTIPVIEEMARFMLKCFEKMADKQAVTMNEMIRKRPFITKQDIEERLCLSADQADYLIEKMIAERSLRILAPGKYSGYQTGKKVQQGLFE